MNNATKRPQAGAEGNPNDPPLANTLAASPAKPVPATSGVAPLAADRLYRATNLSQLAFETTTDLAPVKGLVGQPRAASALHFGSRISKPGFNLFIIGPHGASKQEAVRAVLREQARHEASASDWIYVNNFTDPDKPIAIELPAGRASKFKDAMHALIDDVKTALPAVFRSEDYQSRRTAIDENYQKKQGEAFGALREEAAKKDVVIIRTPFGFALAPTTNGKIIPPEEFSALPEARRAEIQSAIQILERELERIVHQLPQLETEHRDEIRKLNRETAQFIVNQLIEKSKDSFDDLPKIIEVVERVRADLVDNIGLFISKSEDGEGEAEAASARVGGPFDRYDVNVLVSQSDREQGAPVIEELHPTLGNLIGRIEYVSTRGVLVTNFRLIKAGALHQANGGYLLLDVRHILSEPFSWTALKRALYRGEIVIEDISRFLGLTGTVSLQPDPIPLRIKVALFGDRLLYFLLAAFDPELNDHFKVVADFESDFDRIPENEAVLARLIATMAKRLSLKPFDRYAVALVLEHAARLAEHANKLSLVTDRLLEVLNEAEFWATESKRAVVTRDDVDKAINERVYRLSRLRDRAQEAIIQKIALIETTGSRIGQVNGLSVYELGGYSFGRPTRITCQVRPGTGKVVDIEREVELGGPIHSKGVLILSGFLAGRYALDTPMSLFASLVFEQSYGGVEGDSASSAELYALMSALAEVPLRQDLAVTGSVNQHGEVQAIGGVNDKIEGFYDICKARGLTGMQGVLIPQANVQHLMLRQDVVEACAAGRFAIYPIGTVDEGISLLTGVSAGERGDERSFPPGSLNRMIEERLRSFATIRRSFGKDAEHGRTSS